MIGLTVGIHKFALWGNRFEKFMSLDVIHILFQYLIASSSPPFLILLRNFRLIPLDWRNRAFAFTSGIAIHLKKRKKNGTNFVRANPFFVRGTNNKQIEFISSNEYNNVFLSVFFFLTLAQ